MDFFHEESVSLLQCAVPAELPLLLFPVNTVEDLPCSISKVYGKDSLRPFCYVCPSCPYFSEMILLLQKLKPYLQYHPCSQTLTWTIHPLLPESFHFTSKIKENSMYSPHHHAFHHNPQSYVVTLHLSKVPSDSFVEVYMDGRRRW